VVAPAGEAFHQGPAHVSGADNADVYHLTRAETIHGHTNYGFVASAHGFRLAHRSCTGPNTGIYFRDD